MRISVFVLLNDIVLAYTSIQIVDYMVDCVLKSFLQSTSILESSSSGASFTRADLSAHQGHNSAECPSANFHRNRSRENFAID